MHRMNVQNAEKEKQKKLKKQKKWQERERKVRENLFGCERNVSAPKLPREIVPYKNIEEMVKEYQSGLAEKAKSFIFACNEEGTHSWLPCDLRTVISAMLFSNIQPVLLREEKTFRSSNAILKK